MKNYTYTHLTIDSFSSGSHHVCYYTSVNGKGTTKQEYNVDILPYLKKSWELVKRGGTRKFYANPYAPTQFTIEVTLMELP